MKSSLRSLKKQFQLDPKFTYLNHGSFGACPYPIFNEREKWQKEIENQPVSFIEDKAINLIDEEPVELVNVVDFVSYLKKFGIYE